MEILEHIVEYDKYCKTCKYRKLQRSENGEEPEPCDTCLSENINEYSKKPTKYERDESVKEDKE